MKLSVEQADEPWFIPTRSTVPLSKFFELGALKSVG